MGMKIILDTGYIKSLVLLLIVLHQKINLELKGTLIPNIRKQLNTYINVVVRLHDYFKKSMYFSVVFMHFQFGLGSFWV